MATDDPAAPAHGAGVPWAGLAALVLVLLLDRWGLSRQATWVWAGAQQPLESGLGPGLVRDRAELFRLERLVAAAPAHGKVVVFGTSRARRGLQNEAIDPLVGDAVHVHKLAHAGMQPFEILAAVDELLALDLDLDVVVLALSEFDTHRPLRLDPVTGAGSPAALATLLRAGGWPLIAEQGEDLLRLALATQLDCYRYREVARDVGLERFFGLPQLERRAARSGAPDAGDSGLVYARALELLASTWPELSLGARMSGLDQVLSISDGPHVAIQTALVRAAVERLSAAGIDVLLVELPLAPLAARFYDTALNAAFVRLAEQLAELPGVSFVPGVRLGATTLADFVDLTHLGDDASLRVSASLGLAIKRTLALRRARQRAAAGG